MGGHTRTDGARAKFKGKPDNPVEVDGFLETNLPRLLRRKRNP